MRENEIIFANFVLKFGNENLLDYVNQVVIPAFSDKSLVRKYGENTKYFFNNVDLREIKSGDVTSTAIYGRIIKDTKLIRHQIFKREKGLVKDFASLDSAPSAFFILILSSHRLIYCAETKYSPDLSSFHSTINDFIKQKYEIFIRSIHKKSNETLKSLREKHQPPHLEIIPLSKKENIRDFIERYETLKKIEFQLVRPNDELDASEMFEGFRQFSDGVNSKNTKITVSNPNGLNKEQSIKDIQAALTPGNQKVTTSGVDEYGNNINGNNDSFKLSTFRENKQPSDQLEARSLFNIFKRIEDSGVIAGGNYLRDKISNIKQSMVNTYQSITNQNVTNNFLSIEDGSKNDK